MDSIERTNPDTGQLLAFEQNVASRVPKFNTIIQSIIKKSEQQFKQAAFFSTETELDLEKATPAEPLLAEFIEDLFRALDAIKSTEVPGHEVAHIHDNLISALRIMHEYGDLKPYEKFEIICAIIGHDLGRYNEEAFSKTDPKQVEYLIPLFLGRKFVQAHDIKIPETLQMRIIYDIATGGKATTGHRTADAVHQADREQLLGSATIPRGLAFDVLLNNLSLSIKHDQDLGEKLPTPGSEGDTSQLIQYEFYMRNLYPFQSPNGAEVSNILKQEQATILMLGLHGNEEGFAQIFAPELAAGNYTPKHWSKKPIANEIFEKAKEEASLFEKTIDWDEYSEENLHREIISTMNHENILIVDDVEEKVKAKLVELTDDEKRGWWAIIAYTKMKRIEKFRENLNLLQEVTGLLENTTAKRLLPDYQKRLAALME